MAGVEGSDGAEFQRVFVMRHGEREDSRNPLWKKTASRPYDTPITSRGATEAHRLTGKRLSGKARLCVETSCVEREFHKAYLRLRWHNGIIQCC